MSIEFKAALQRDGKTATGITVPEDVVAKLGGGRRIPVAVTIASVTYPSTIAYMDGIAKIPVSAEIRAAAGLTADDLLTVTVERDAAPRTVEVPADLAAGLASAGQAERFAALSYSNQRRHVLAVSGARTEQTRERRIEHILAELADS
ncbi:MAG TPA: YdeI/OmpD-associated family protein [Microbacteriaceae bacterium]